MTWIRKSPFPQHEDPVKNMVLLLSRAVDSGTPFSNAELTLLANEAVPGASIPHELRTKARKLIEQILKRDEITGGNDNPKSFLRSLEWAADISNANVVAFTVEVISSGQHGK